MAREALLDLGEGRKHMSDQPQRPDYQITDEAEMRALFPSVSELARQKCQDRLDRHARDFISRSPFLCLGTQAPDGRADVSPRGDPRGFVRVLDDQTLAIPDRPGNNRLDSLSNILGNPQIGLLFMIPGFDDTLRVNGLARLSVDPELLVSLAVDEKLPRLAILVEVREVFLHCAKAFRRSQLWDPAARQDRRDMPSLSQMILEQTTGAPRDPTEMERIDADLEVSYRRSMY